MRFVYTQSIHIRYVWVYPNFDGCVEISKLTSQRIHSHLRKIILNPKKGRHLSNQVAVNSGIWRQVLEILEAGSQKLSLYVFSCTSCRFSIQFSSQSKCQIDLILLMCSLSFRNVLTPTTLLL